MKQWLATAGAAALKLRQLHCCGLQQFAAVSTWPEQSLLLTPAVTTVGLTKRGRLPVKHAGVCGRPCGSGVVTAGARCERCL